VRARSLIDVGAIEPGVDFAGDISRAMASCQVLLAVIGPAWLPENLAPLKAIVPPENSVLEVWA